MTRNVHPSSFLVSGNKHQEQYVASMRPEQWTIVASMQYIQYHTSQAGDKRSGKRRSFKDLPMIV